jgi:hypothetical protein
MSKAYRIEFTCPKGSHTISFQRKCSKPSLSETEAMKMYAHEEIFCTRANCGWRGKASRAKVARIIPFDWVLAPAL